MHEFRCSTKKFTFLKCETWGFDLRLARFRFSLVRFGSAVKSKINKKQENKLRMFLTEAFFEMKIVYWKTSNGSFEIFRRKKKQHQHSIKRSTKEKHCKSGALFSLCHRVTVDTFGVFQCSFSVRSRAQTCLLLSLEFSFIFFYKFCLSLNLALACSFVQSVMFCASFFLLS